MFNKDKEITTKQRLWLKLKAYAEIDTLDNQICVESVHHLSTYCIVKGPQLKLNTVNMTAFITKQFSTFKKHFYLYTGSLVCLSKHWVHFIWNPLIEYRFKSTLTRVLKMYELIQILLPLILTWHCPDCSSVPYWKHIKSDGCADELRYNNKRWCIKRQFSLRGNKEEAKIVSYVQKTRQKLSFKQIHLAYKYQNKKTLRNK